MKTIKAAALLMGAALSLSAQDKAAPKNPAAVPDTFEVASIRAVQTNLPRGLEFLQGCGYGRPTDIDAKRFRIASVPLTQLIAFAYGANCSNSDLIAGAPDWSRKDRYDIQAVIPDGAPAYTLDQFLSGRAPNFQEMLRALLADRFKLAMHRESKEMSVYVLMVAKGGPKLTPWREGAKDPFLDLFGFPQDSARPVSMRAGAFCSDYENKGMPYCKMTGSKKSVEEIGGLISIWGGLDFQPVLDHTGIKGEFNFYLEFDRDGGSRQTLSKALEEQVGLKLERTKAPVEIWVIDHVEKPSEN